MKDFTYLVYRGKSKLQVLQCETQNLENQLTKLKVELKPQNFEEINPMDGTLKAICRKCGAQLGILEKFKEMFNIFEAEHKVMVEKAFAVEQASKNVTNKYKICKWHKIAHVWQVQLMVQSGIPIQSLHPFLVAFNVEPLVFYFSYMILISSCSFCGQGFEPA